MAHIINIIPITIPEKLLQINTALKQEIINKAIELSEDSKIIKDLGLLCKYFNKNTYLKEKAHAINRCFWLGWRDSNPRVTESKSVALPLGDSPIYT